MNVWGSSILMCPNKRLEQDYPRGEFRDGLPTRTRTWSSRLGGGSFIRLNYGENGAYSTDPIKKLNKVMGLAGKTDSLSVLTSQFMPILTVDGLGFWS